MKDQLAKAIRVLTVAPLMALCMLVIFFVSDPASFGSGWIFAESVFFLTVLPLLAYPLQPALPHFKGKGREAQRSLAMYFAVAGYVLGFLTSWALHAPRLVMVIFLLYLLSGLLILAANKLLHRKASGHACGVIGPFAALIFYGRKLGYLVIPLFSLVCWASLRTKRHTVRQLMTGAVIPLLALCGSVLLGRFF